MRQVFPTAWKTNSDVGMAALARTIDDTAHDRHRERLYTGILQAPQRHLLFEVRLHLTCQLLKEVAGCPATSWTCCDLRAKGTKTHALQQILCDADFARAITSRFWCQ